MDFFNNQLHVVDAAANAEQSHRFNGFASSFAGLSEDCFQSLGMGNTGLDQFPRKVIPASLIDQMILIFGFRSPTCSARAFVV